MPILILADHDNHTLSEATARLLTAAGRLGDAIDILVAGQGVAPVAEAAARLAGARSVLVADGEALAHFIAEPVADILVQLADRYDAILAAANSSGKDVLPRVAARLDVMQLSDVVAIKGADVFSRPIYAGNAIETVRSRDGKKIVTVRTSSFEAASTLETSAPIETLAFDAGPVRTRFVRLDASPSDRPDLSSARIIVSGGRALGSKQAFETTIVPLADKLNAAIGASRAAVDSGYVPNDWQVGQTGKIVAPDLYIACGISGAIQHVAGMKDSKVIVAINSDAEAPIFAVADYGLVADIFEAVPELTGKL
ncbi:electron transfer flavoprotein subunit alpha/FixB family protein [Pelagibacterium lacus]|uniref:Electron transfer flavoprotein subunit alpha n=1 Tax=Pelagibacterium lacus TaxID=2282655 RepID=A0A369W697_9HYPH|nr:electron transfer flavoprotein subunit alpha/FixB family protein [Pelagibacterium lacus]RDE09557.1 electron transfer flavoprotein subunit alpha/FixB family protein [Pelagibacterium lacus]